MYDIECVLAFIDEKQGAEADGPAPLTPDEIEDIQHITEAMLREEEREQRGRT